MSDPTTSSCPIACPRPNEPFTAGRHELLALQQAMVAGELSPDRWQRDLVQIQCDLDETIAPDVLRQCLDQLILRHDSLRAYFDWDSGGVGRQSVGSPISAQFDLLDIVDLDKDQADARAAKAIEATWTQPFDVTRPPRLRALLIAWSRTRYQLFLTYQETELDEHSGKTLIRELFELYDHAIERRPDTLPQPIPFGHYLDWLAANRDPEACHFWGDLLNRAPAPTPPPLMGTGSCDRSLSYCLGQLSRALSEESTTKLKRIVAKHRTNLNAALLAAWSVVLAAHTGEPDVRFAAVFSLRTPAYAQARSAVAMCFSVLPFVVRGAINRPLDQLLDDVRAQEQAAREHSAFLDGSAATRRQLGHPNSQSLIFFDEVDVDTVVHQAHPEWTHRRFSLFGRNPYAIAMRGFGGSQMRIQAWYNPQSYSHDVVNCLLDQVVDVLERLASRTSDAIGPQDLLSRAQERLVCKWEVGELQPYLAATLHEMFEDQARRTPNSIAVVGEGCTLSYEQLSAESSSLAHLLVQSGLQRGGTVAVCMSRSPDVVISVLAILKAGGAYVPIDGAWPVQRIVSVLSRLGTTLIITDASRATQVSAAAAELETPLAILQLNGTRPEGPCSHVKWLGREAWASLAPAMPPSSGNPDDLAYVIFTSGSTGAPKGVAVCHRPVCNLIDWARRNFSFGTSDRVLWVTSLGFDLSVFDLFGILATGGSIRIASDEDLQSPHRLVEILATEPITFWNSAPQALERLRHFWDTSRLPTSADLSRLRLVFLSGDWIPLSLPDAIRHRFANAQVISLGGATEATVWSNSFPVGTVEPGWRSIPYGRPMQNARYCILDAHQRRCGIGIVGELFIGGEVLASGYAGDAQQTAERFVPDPYAGQANARMYRTGDLARWWPDGNIELLGRIDNQVKVRGYRIELGELEHALRSHPGVRDAVATVHRNAAGENQLVAHLVTQGNATVSYGSLRGHLQQILPEYMIPATFVPMQTLPMTANGKVDRRALLHVQPGPALRERPHVAPRTAAESLLARIFCKVLGIPEVGAMDQFFELGGDSLNALSVIFSAEQAGLQITMDMLRKHPVEVLATSCTAQRPSPRHDATTQYDPLPLTPNQQWLVDRGLANPAAYAFSTWLQSSEPIDLDALSLAWQAVTNQHEALRIRFRQTSLGIVQSVSASGGITPPQVVDLRPTPAEQILPALESHAVNVSREAKLLKDALPRLMCARVPDGRDLLFLFIPHIITDEYSARIIIEDLGIAYQAIRHRKPVHLPPATLSFSQWAMHLGASARRPEIGQAVEEFCQLPWNTYRRLPKDFDEGTNTYADAQDLRVMLSQPETEQLGEAARKYRLPMSSVVTTAATASVKAWSGGESALLDFTSVGRDPLFGLGSLHRSVGYFSTIHPVLLQRPGDLADAATCQQVHHALQSPPLSGSLYGLARYLHPDPLVREMLADLPQAEIKLNYHGQQPLCDESNPFQQATLRVPYTLASTDSRRYLLNLEIGYREGCLVTACKYPAAVYRRATIQQFLEDYLGQLHSSIQSVSRVSSLTSRA